MGNLQVCFPGGTYMKHKINSMVKAAFSMVVMFALYFGFSVPSAAQGTRISNKTVQLEWNPTFTVDASEFKGIDEGSRILLSYTNTKADYHQVKMYAGDWFSLAAGNVSGARPENGSFVTTESKGKIIYTVSKDEAEHIKATGLRLHGFGMKITGISLLTDSALTVTTDSGADAVNTGSGSQPSDGRRENSSTVFIGSRTLDWGSTLSIEAGEFKGFKDGDKIRISYQNTNESYHNVKIYSGNWANLNSGVLANGANNGGTFVPSRDSGELIYEPNAGEAESLRRNGLIMHGYGVRVTEISLSSSGSEGKTDNPSSGTAGTVTVASETVTSNPVPSAETGTPFGEHGKLHVNGAYLYDSRNQKYQLYGMSTHGLNFGQDFSRYVNREAFKTLRDDWNTNCIRLVLYPRDYNGYLNGGNRQELKKLICGGIDYATELGMYVIVDWHVHNYNPRETENEAVAFLSEISSRYAGYGNVLYEICNEPTGSDWNGVIKPYAEKVIPAIRKNAPESIIIVGTNTWSQDIEGPLSNPLSFGNVMYTFHFYAQTHTASFRKRVETAVKKGLPIFVTEFGTCDASGNGGFNKRQSEEWFKLLEKYGISHCNWSLSNKAETASAINSWCGKTSGWTQGDLTESGRLIYNHFRKLKR